MTDGRDASNEALEDGDMIDPAVLEADPEPEPETEPEDEIGAEPFENLEDFSAGDEDSSDEDEDEGRGRGRRR